MDIDGEAKKEELLCEDNGVAIFGDVVGRAYASANLTVLDDGSGLTNGEGENAEDAGDVVKERMVGVCPATFGEFDDAI